MTLPDKDAAELRELEERLLQPAVRRSSGELERLLADDFVEFGVSGKRYDRRQIIDALAREALPGEVRVSDFRATALAMNLALVTYRSDCAGRRALRSSIWRRRAGAWQLVFHQGTLTG